MDPLRYNARVDQRALVRRHERRRPAHVKVSGADQFVIEPFRRLAAAGRIIVDAYSVHVRREFVADPLRNVKVGCHPVIQPIAKRVYRAVVARMEEYFLHGQYWTKRRRPHGTLRAWPVQPSAAVGCRATSAVGMAPFGPSVSDKKSMKVRTFDVMYLRLV